MKSYQLIYSETFSSELEEIIQYKNSFYHADANDFYEKFLKKVERLKRFPYSAPAAPKYYSRLRSKGCRILHVDRYNLFFTIKGKKILFHTIRHAARKPN